VKWNAPSSKEVWYLDSGASNHMTQRKEWFSYLEKPKKPGVVSTGDGTPHPVANVGEVPLSCVGQKGKLMNVLHVPTIAQYLVSIGQIVDHVKYGHLMTVFTLSIGGQAILVICCNSSCPSLAV
jgi:hypothetical protein